MHTDRKPSQAFAAAKFGDACLRAMRGDAGVVECSYVASAVCLHHPNIHPSYQPITPSYDYSHFLSTR
jgi:hypothetical protein